ncbi:MAG: tetratricopeptide repeat protein [Deltaproteobacteria bacterium]|nr:tetratricopeptide repeat protein [Deltaproteobacteria bacterium]
MKKCFFYLWVLIAMNSCSSGTIKVESLPEGAEIFISVNGQMPRKIGITPLVVQESQVNSGNESFQISLVKEGFLSENILAPASIFPRSSAVQVKLKEITAAKKVGQSDDNLQKISSSIAQIVDHIKNKEYDLAEKNLVNLQTQFPSVSTVYELLGNVFYLKKDLSKAHGYYKRALDLNPNNVDTNRMIQKIESIRSDLRSPASNGGI